MSSRLKYSRNALCINALPFARYFRQRFAPFFRHRRWSQGYPYILSYIFHFTFSIFNLTSAVFHRFVHQNSCGNRRIKGIYLTFHGQ